MFNLFKTKIKKNAEIFALFILIFLTVITTSYYNSSKKKIYDTIENLKKLDGYELFDKNDYSNYDGTLIKNLINDNNDNESIDSSLKSASSDETYNDKRKINVFFIIDFNNKKYICLNYSFNLLNH